MTDTMVTNDTFSILTPNATLCYGYRQDRFRYVIGKPQPAAVIVIAAPPTAEPTSWA